jgi:hypothetical protein
LISFITTPSRTRANLVLVGLVAGSIALERVTTGPVASAISVLVILAVVSLLRYDGTGAVSNTASLVVGRPIALTARGRAGLSVDHLTAEQRRLLRLTGWTALVSSPSRWSAASPSPDTRTNA